MDGLLQRQQASDAQAHQLPWHGTGRGYHVARGGKTKGWEANLCSFLCHSLHKRVHFRMSQLHLANIPWPILFPAHPKPGALVHKLGDMGQPGQLFFIKNQ